MATPEGFGGNVKGVKKFVVSTLGVRNIRGFLNKATHFQGIGRHSPEEVVSMAKRDLDSISAFLGDKPYIQGDKPTTVSQGKTIKVFSWTRPHLVTLSSFIGDPW